MSDLKRAGPAKRTALRSMIKDAIAHGYMQRSRVNGGGHGQFKWVTLVFESPDLNPDYEPGPSVGFRPMAPSVGFPPVGNPPTGDPPTGDPPTENLPIYRYILVLKQIGQKQNGKETEELIFDDDGFLHDPTLVFSVQEKRDRDQVLRANREAAQMAAAWASAMIIDWLPDWTGGERFAEQCDDEQVHTLATWLWTYIEIARAAAMWGRRNGGRKQAFSQRNGNPFEEVSNPIGKIIAQVRLGNDAPLTDYDMANCASAIIRHGDPGAILFDVN